MAPTTTKRRPWLRLLILLCLALVLTAVSLFAELGFFWKAALDEYNGRPRGSFFSHPIVRYFRTVTDRPLFCYLLAGTALWWLGICLVLQRLWRRRRSALDACWAMPLILGSAVMFGFRNYIHYVRTAGAPWDSSGRFSIGFPLRMASGFGLTGGPSYFRWHWGAVLANFAVWTAAFATVIWPVIILLQRRRAMRRDVSSGSACPPGGTVEP